MRVAANSKPAAKLSKKERIRQAKAKKRRDREAGSDDEDLGLGAPLEDRLVGIVINSDGIVINSDECLQGLARRLRQPTTSAAHACRDYGGSD